MEQFVVVGIAILCVTLYFFHDLIFFQLFTPRRKCPDCSEVLPRFRKPDNLRQLCWGGWTCPKCGCNLNSRGRKIKLRKAVTKSKT
jgi:hypothetical protein